MFMHEIKWTDTTIDFKNVLVIIGVNLNALEAFIIVGLCNAVKNVILLWSVTEIFNANHSTVWDYTLHLISI